MHTMMVLLAGFALLAAFLVLAGVIRVRPGVAAMIFIPIWFLAAAVNMWVGVTRAGYTVAEEFPIFLAIFAVPTVVAMVVWWKNARV